jgi:hypothetical protein
MQKTKYIAAAAAKWVLALLALVFLIRISSTGRTSSADFTAVADAVGGTVPMDQVVEGDRQMIRRLYGLDPADYEGVRLYYPSTNMGVEEVLVVKLSDLSQQQAVRAAMEARVQSQMDVFESYAPEQYGILQNSVIEVQGNYLLLAVGKDPAAAQRAFLEAL